MVFPEDWEDSQSSPVFLKDMLLLGRLLLFHYSICYIGEVFT